MTAQKMSVISPTIAFLPQISSRSFRIAAEWASMTYVLADTTRSIIIGPILGQFEVFDKIAKLHAKNGFSFAIVLGDLFGNSHEASDDIESQLGSFLNGKSSVPLPTYFSIGKYALPDEVIRRIGTGDGEVCDNLFFLGKRSTTKMSDGLRVVTLGGSLDTNMTTGLSKDTYLPFHTEGDAKALQGAHRADLLLTYVWPASVRVNSHLQPPREPDELVGEQCISDLSTSLKPRYHLSVSEDLFFERAPFFHLSTENQPDASAITRFVSVAAYNNKSKEKWLYAFSIDPGASNPSSMPSGTTASPFLPSGKKRQHLPDQAQSFSRFLGSENGQGQARHAKRARHKGPPPGPQECFFCLSNPNLAAHLIASIGNESYLTIAKGPLSTSGTYESIDFPTHILIIPLSHSPNFINISAPETRKSTFEEMTRYRQALQKLISVHSKGLLGAVTWELSRGEGVHLHWQFLPVSTDLIQRGLVMAGFQVQAENDQYAHFAAKEIGDGSQVKEDYFRVWIYHPADGDTHPPDQTDPQLGTEQQLVLPLPSDRRFDLQFGRRVMAKLLGLESRLNWRDCSQTEEEERSDVGSFKTAFKAFDFSSE